jgi:sulfite reductase (ferredoxin)
MINYRLPPTLNRNIDQFENDLTDFLSGNLHKTAFRAKRVKMGIYQERGRQTYMCRIRCGGNVVTPKQLMKIGDLAKRYGSSGVHVTTRAEIQIHRVKLEDAILIIRELATVGLSMKGGGGHTIRNICTNHDSGSNPNELFDVQPYAIALTSRLISEVDSFELPRKFKTSFSSLAEDAADCAVQDLGFIAAVNEKGEKGFKVYVGGGLGFRPKLAILLHDFIPENKVYHVAKSIKNVFHTYGNRRNSHHSRLRFLIHDDLGEERFRELYGEELDKIYDDDSLELEVNPIDNNQNLYRQIELEPLRGEIEGYETWRDHYVTIQKQQGLFSVKLPLNLGDLGSEDCFRLAKILSPFGQNALRCGRDQNFHIRNIPEKFLKNVYNGLKQLQTLIDSPVIYGKIVPCMGAQTCQLGINYPRPATTAIFEQFERTDLDFDILQDISIHISGCPNACANHWIADLGFFGKVRRVEGRPIPTYNVLGGAKVKTGESQLGERVGWVHARDLPQFIAQVMKQYQDYRATTNGYTDFYLYWHNGGKEFVGSLCQSRFNQIPTFETDENYYFDHGATEVFSTKNIVGEAECSAGLYDMINVDDKAIKKNLKIIESWEEGGGDLEATLKETVFLASRMLLITRGEEPRTEGETYGLFLQHFIDVGLVNKDHQFIIETVQNGTSEKLKDYRDKIIALGHETTILYKSMDNTMRFPGEKENLTINMEAKIDRAKSEAVYSSTASNENKSEQIADKFKDLRGVKCPINFAQTKVQLAAMKSRETLEILLDDGEPIKNVPGSVKLDGHLVLKQERVGEHWTVLIEKT